MLRRIASAYLWVAPLMIVPLWYAYHQIGLRAGILCGVAHLVLMGLGMWVLDMFRWEELSTAYGLARLLLTGGGGIVWAIGAAGPPRRHDITLAFYNNAGLIVGLFVIFLGLAALKDELQTEKKGALAAVGHASFSFSFVVWIMECFLIWVILRAPAAGLPKAQQPDWLLSLFFVWDWIDSVRLGSVYVAGATFALAGILTSRINRWPGRLMLAFSLLGVIFGVAQKIPFFIPAVTCVVPYCLGVTLRRPVGSERV